VCQENELSEVFQLCKSQSGCRCIQDKISYDSTYANNVLYPYLIKASNNEMLELICDQFGNYMFQQLIDIFTYQNMSSFLSFISFHFFTIAYSTHGTRLIQKLIEYVSQNKSHSALVYDFLVSHLKNNIADIAMNENGNHIIQKSMLLFNSQLNNFIYEELYANFLQIATSKYGCCVMQKALIKSIDKQQQLNIIYLILQNTHQLITNQFGNYLYQSLIFMNDDCIIVKICEIISNNFIKYCKEKYSSNVVEKLFDIPNQRLLNKIALIICENSETILDLVTDQYGNYIIQKILNNANCEYITNLILRVISNHYSQVVKTSLGKKIVMKINNSLNPKQKV
jgi:hypothetical protein